MKKHLYIIGNGFDKHHDIPSGYQDYRHWLEQNEAWGIIETIDDVFGYTDDDWWRHFEENLASAETLRIATEEAFQNYPDFGNDGFRDRDWYAAELSVERKMKNAYEVILDSFNEWVKQLPYGDANKIIMLQKGSIFMTFNYTHTLELLYNIPPERILHIHGQAGNDEELTFGHGSTYKELEKKMGERVDEGDFVLQRAKDAAIYAVSQRRKKVEEIIESYHEWFTSLSDIKYIHIYGHSLGDVDSPYFRKIFDYVNKGKIHIEISDYKSENKKRIHQFMKTEHFRRNQYTIVELLNLCLRTTI